MRKYIEDACDELDAAIFSGDEFHNPESRKRLREFMTRWERELKSFDELPVESNGEE